MFAAAMVLLALAGWYEFVAMLRQKKVMPLNMLGGLLLLAMPVSTWLYGIGQVMPFVFFALSVILSMVVLNYERFSL